jgi:hypothetical protein
MFVQVSKAIQKLSENMPFTICGLMADLHLRTKNTFKIHIYSCGQTVQIMDVK